MTLEATMANYDIDKVRRAFPILATLVHGKPLIYLDTAASAQKPEPVFDAMKSFATGSYANVKRSAHALAENATRAYENARGVVAKYLNAHPDEVIFTSGTTDSLNKAARAVEPSLAEGDEVLVSAMEHHSSFVPWQQVAERRRCAFRAIPLTPEYRLDIDALSEMLTDRTRVVAIAHVSNTLGTINPIERISRLVREHAPNALLVVDGAQAVPHGPVDVRALDCDLYAFSGHKVYGPTGIGVLYGKRAVLESLAPPAWGGEMVDTVTIEHTTWAPVPARFEAGTPNIIGAVGLAAALRWLDHLGWDAIRAYESDLVQYTIQQLKGIPGITLIGPSTVNDRGGQFSFTLGDWHPHDLAAVLDARGIAVRAGHHCTQPLHRSLGIDATVRASIALHTTRDEIDVLVAALREAAEPAPTDKSTVFDGPMTPEQELLLEEIKDHAIRPRNKRRIEGVEPVHGRNPNCGDKVDVYLTVKNGEITDIAFEGSGCAISQASMSKLTNGLKGKDAHEALDLGLDEVNKLLGIDFSTKPVRAKCAMLGLRATQEAIRRCMHEPIGEHP